MQKIVIISSSRADYGILKWVALEIQKYYNLQFILIGSNIKETFELIKKDGFYIERTISIEFDNDSNLKIAENTGIVTWGISDVLSEINPDLLLILGDRYETLAVTTAALLLKIPVAHIAGGDITEGAFDDSIRHAITKMSHLHFVTNEQSKQVVIQLGENPEHIFNVGNPGLDILDNFVPKSKEELEKEFGYKFGLNNLLITFHPETLNSEDSKYQFSRLLVALNDLQKYFNYHVLFTYPNADPNNQSIIESITNFIVQFPWAFAAKYLGQQNYLSFVHYCDMVIGNSSSGLYEVPSFNRVTINIGDRQKGRLRAKSVIDCKCEIDSIKDAILDGFNLHCFDNINPYRQNGNSSKKIVEELRKIDDFKKLLVKKFYVKE